LASTAAGAATRAPPNVTATIMYLLLEADD